ncbi:Aryldialkylphosphatase [Plasmopara halstedii]|uniref:Aryldialkylphosphatase n=1 Tax=Plasmopara halstedii TaxID=4781 RepID=A0A0P1ANI0_PLAHL|nr:Aryldialkylphosphatase [Plasmopara halstedii]CEG42690.1 Aryldialkylphosphatase [Plasmopara halstedii]|eukprot:XP_024579059.1 Aryldialkylphosphatase [Plasmopara halstedii]
MIRTIQKLVDPEDVDVVLPHEHVLHNIGANVAIISSQKSLEIRIEDLIDYRHAPFAHGGRNMLLQNEDEAFRELERLQRSNSSKQVILVVDVTLPVEGRDLLVNKRLSLAKRLKDVHLLTVSTVETTLMNDIVNSGLSIEDQSERIANMLEAELIYGIKREECVAYPGAIYQQIELSGKKMNAQEQVLIRGLAMAQARTHAPVYLSFSVDEKIEPFNFKDIIREWIKVLTDAGAERRKLVLCHADRYCHGESEGSDLSFLIELLDFGITILFDTIGLLALSFDEDCNFNKGQAPLSSPDALVYQRAAADSVPTLRGSMEADGVQECRGPIVVVHSP